MELGPGTRDQVQACDQLHSATGDHTASIVHIGGCPSPAVTFRDTESLGDDRVRSEETSTSWASGPRAWTGTKTILSMLAVWGMWVSEYSGKIIINR